MKSTKSDPEQLIKPKKRSWDNKISTIGIVYFLIGFVFATIYAIYYHWPILGFLSPGFWAVSFTWPVQAIGFIRDLLYYGLAGKPTGL